MPSLSSLIATTYKPKSETIPLIRSALKIYKVCAYITGIFLLLLVVEMILKYVFSYEVELGGPSGIVTLVNYFPNLGKSPGLTGVNLSIGILIVHGWFYGLHDGLLQDLKMTVSSAEQMIPAFEQALEAVHARHLDPDSFSSSRF